jgi:hypothetical protein
MSGLSEICEELRSLQRRRAWFIKSRNMVANRLRATVAGASGYSTSMTEGQRRKAMKDADETIKKVKEGMEHPCSMLILTTLPAIEGFDDARKALEKEMLKLAKRLPAAAWVEKPEQRGFGLLFLAIVIGETGDLNNYANPAKVWRRLGCAPFQSNGKTLMGATWRKGKEGKLSADEWEQFGYSPRRRSIAYLIGESIVKQNFMSGNGDHPFVTDSPGAKPAHPKRKAKGASDFVRATDCPTAGPYRFRYDEAKRLAAEKHPEWVQCSACKGKGNKGNCQNCGGTGRVMKRCHLHGMLLASKLLLKNLWVEWTSGGDAHAVTEVRHASAHSRNG